MKKPDHDATIPVLGTYRGISLHAGQCERRLTVVRSDIDSVYARETVDDLMAFTRDTMRAPEARLFAGAKLQAMYESAVDNREARPAIDLRMVDALLAGVDSVDWRDPRQYRSLLCVYDGVPRDPDDEPLQ